MAGKITDLAALTGAGAATTDLIEAVDISDTTMAATGTNKKMTLTELVNFLAANGLVIATRTVSTTAPLSGGGDLTANRTLVLSDDGVTNAKLANMATLTLKGNATGATADPADLNMLQLGGAGLVSNTGAFFRFDFSTTTTSGPTFGTLRLNNATPASATIVYVHYNAKDQVDLRIRLLAGTTGDRLYIQQRTDSTIYRLYELTSAPTDGGTYATCNVVHRIGTGALWANNADIVAGFTSPPITVSSSAPASPLTNDLWIDTT